MDSEKKIKVGDKVLCIKEPNIPRYIGTIWEVIDIRYGLYYCVNYILSSEEFVFKEDEVVLASSLIEELL